LMPNIQLWSLTPEGETITSGYALCYLPFSFPLPVFLRKSPRRPSFMPRKTDRSTKWISTVMIQPEPAYIHTLSLFSVVDLRMAHAIMRYTLIFSGILSQGATSWLL